MKDCFIITSTSIPDGQLLWRALSARIDYKQFNSTIDNPVFVDRAKKVPGWTPHEEHTLEYEGEDGYKRDFRWGENYYETEFTLVHK